MRACGLILDDLPHQHQLVHIKRLLRRIAAFLQIEALNHSRIAQRAERNRDERPFSSRWRQGKFWTCRTVIGGLDVDVQRFARSEDPELECGVAAGVDRRGAA